MASSGEPFPQPMNSPEITPRPAAIVPERRSRFSMRQREAFWFYVAISPWLIGFLVFTLGPMAASLYLSFTSWDLFTPPQWVGLDNYRELLTDDPLFWKVLYNTFYYAFLAVPLNMAVALVIAFLLTKPLRGMRFYRTLVYVPSLVPVVASAMLFTWLFAPDAGLINRGLALIGIQGPAWLFDVAWVKPALVVMSLWGIGGAVVLLVAGIQSVPQEFYEAAALDGASQFNQFFQITLPMLTPVVLFNLVTGLIGAFQIFAQVYIMTNGGPDDASLMIVPYLFNNGFRFFEMGYASALAWILFVIILAFSLLVLRSSSIWVYYESEVQR